MLGRGKPPNMVPRGRHFLAALRAFAAHEGVLSITRRPFEVGFVPAELIDALAEDPDAIPAFLREIDDRRRRERVRAVPDPPASIGRKL